MIFCDRARFFSTFCLFMAGNTLFFFLQLLWSFIHQKGFADALSYPTVIYWELFKVFVLQWLFYGILSFLQTFFWLFSPFALRRKRSFRLEALAVSLRDAAFAFPQAERKALTLTFIIIYSATIVTLMSLNAHFFPGSQFGKIWLSMVFFQNTLFLVIGLLTLSLMILPLFFLSLTRLFIGSLIIALFYVAFLIEHEKEDYHREALSKPNLIMLGIDSLPPHEINSKRTPHLSTFLNESIAFDDVISPLARTFPAWMTILTGCYPKHHRARENLFPKEYLLSKRSIATYLKAKGYYTVFLSDDRRFNHLGKEAGFDEVVGPPTDLLEILLGSFYDFPLSNLLMNTRLGHVLFPHQHGNRASSFSYFPESFDKTIARTLERIPSHQPVFLAIHFTLTHWPYTWASSSPQSQKEFGMENRYADYQKALERVDTSFFKLKKYLAKTGWLNNALVILLSDHGETFYELGSRQTKARLYQGDLKKSPFLAYLHDHTETHLEKSAGHGSDILSPAQFSTLLSFQFFQNNRELWPSQKIKNRVSLIDIAPTIAHLFHLDFPKGDGISLGPTLLHGALPAERVFMLESGMLPNRFLSRDLILYYAKLFFEVRKDNLAVQIKPSQFETLLKMKLYGILENEWLLALYPQNEAYVSVLLNLNTGEWSDEPLSPFMKKTPYQKLFRELTSFYHLKIVIVQADNLTLGEKSALSPGFEKIARKMRSIDGYVSSFSRDFLGRWAKDGFSVYQREQLLKIKGVS